jgi:zinc protease
MLDRTIAPELQPNRRLNLPELKSLRLDNGIQVYLLQIGRQPILELNVGFPAGKSFEHRPGLSSMTSRMLSEGTKNSTGYEFARRLDAYGVSIDTEAGHESANVSLSTLSRHMVHTIPLLREMITEPRFEVADFDLLVKRTLNSLEVEEKKTEYIVRREFGKLLFGDSHTYGQHVGREEIAAMQHGDIGPFHQQFYAPANAQIVAAGLFDADELIQVLNAQFGQLPITAGFEKPVSAASLSHPAAEKGLHYFPMDDARQATIRAGHPGFERSHPDFYLMEVTNMIFGGYFSSRLNKIIREEKGYTYGIHSQWVSLKYGGYLIIHTDVGNEYIRPTLEQIRTEMKKLQDHGTTEEELSLVKSYMLSRLISSRETPGQLVETISALFVNGLPYEELDRKFDHINNVTVAQVQQMAQKWFRPDDLLEVVSGKLPEEA